MAHDVFISYSRADEKIADEICKAFEGAGIGYWIDREGIGGGETFLADIVEAIDESKIAVFISSVNSNKSKYAVQEVIHAFQSSKNIIPLCIDQEPYSKDLVLCLCGQDKVAYWKEKESAIQKLVKRVCRFLGKEKKSAWGAIEMVFVQGGTFMMGATPEQGGDCHDDEKPAHQVTLSEYSIGKYEVTQGQWKEVMSDNPSYFKGDDNLPVENVSWGDVQEFIRKLNKKTGESYRLPTEAEWEYAARGGSQSREYKYSGSNNVNDVAWYWDNSEGKTHPVGTKEANELGIYDMIMDFHAENKTLKIAGYISTGMRQRL